MSNIIKGKLTTNKHQPIVNNLKYNDFIHESQK
jgi:hypothetical protein